MSALSQPEANRSNRDAESIGPVPEANQPGHHPEVEQDKPYAKFAAMETPRQEDSPSSSKRIVMVVVTVAGGLLVLAAAKAIIGRRRSSQIEQVARSVTDFVTDTAETVKDTVKDLLPTSS